VISMTGEELLVWMEELIEEESRIEVRAKGLFKELGGELQSRRHRCMCGSEKSTANRCHFTLLHLHHFSCDCATYLLNLDSLYLEVCAFYSVLGFVCWIRIRKKGERGIAMF